MNLAAGLGAVSARRRAALTLHCRCVVMTRRMSCWTRGAQAGWRLSQAASGGSALPLGLLRAAVFWPERRRGTVRNANAPLSVRLPNGPPTTTPATPDIAPRGHRAREAHQPRSAPWRRASLCRRARLSAPLGRCRGHQSRTDQPLNGDPVFSENRGGSSLKPVPPDADG